MAAASLFPDNIIARHANNSKFEYLMLEYSNFEWYDKSELKPREGDFMTSILAELYRGGYAPAARSHSPDSLYSKALGRMVELEAELYARLPEEDAERFRAYDAASAELTEITGELGFEEGVRLGMRLMMEAGFSVGDH